MRRITRKLRTAVCLVASFALAASMLPAAALAYQAGGVAGASPEAVATASSGGRLEIVQIAVSHAHSAALMSDGSLWMWGSNYFGELGDGTTEDRYSPVKVMDNVAQVSLGDAHSAVLKEDGTLWTWGNNMNGELGDGTTTNRLAPVEIMDGVSQVAAGEAHCAAVKTDGTLWTWGYNNYGELGDGTTARRLAPVEIMDGVSQVSVGRYHSAAVKTDGTLWTWGYNDRGQLGDGTTTNHSSPAMVLEDVSRVSLGALHSAAIKTDGTLLTWGDNGDCQLGDGTTSDYRRSPVEIMEGVSRVALGYDCTAAVKSDGTLWMWGSDHAGQFGEPQNIRKNTPQEIMQGASQVAVWDNHIVVLKEDGSLWTQGSNAAGQLGIGTADSSIHSSPVCIFRDGEWLYGGASPIDLSDYTDFELGRDNNSFYHRLSNDPDSGFYGVLNYSMGNIYGNAFALESDLGGLETLKLLAGSKTVLPEGWCFGIAATMSLVHEGHLSVSDITSDTADTYFGMTRPCLNEMLLQTLNYYYLSQHTLESKVGRSYVPEGMIEGNAVYLPGGASDYSGFLNALVSAARGGDLLFAKPGHAFMIVGITDNADGACTLVVYDGNSVNPERPEGAFGRIDVDLESNEMTYTDHNGTTFDNEYFSNNHLWFASAADIAGATGLGIATAKGRSVLSLPLGKQVVVKSKTGTELLAVTGRVIRAAVPIYNLVSRLLAYSGEEEAADEVVELEVDRLDGIVIEAGGEAIDISLRDSEHAAQVSGRFESLTLDFEEGISVEGEISDYSVGISAAGEVDGGNPVLIVSGERASNLSISNNVEGAAFEVSSDGASEGTSVTLCDGGDPVVDGGDPVDVPGAVIDGRTSIDASGQVTARAVDAPTAATGLVYTGGPLTGVAEGEGYAVEGGTATEAGGHVATVTLSEGYEWSDGTTDPLEIGWSIEPAAVTSAALSKASYAYTGKAQKPSVKSVKAGSLSLGASDYTVKYSNASSKTVGTYKVTVTGRGNFAGSATATYKITKAANKAMAARTVVKKAFRASVLKKRAQAVALPKVTTTFGTAKWKVTTKDKKKVLTLKNGKVRVKKGAKKGIYTIKLKATVAGTRNYKAASTKVVTVRVTVK